MNRHNFKSWFFATRPWSFPASSMPIVTTLAYLFWTGESINWGIGIWTLINIIVFHAAGNTWSDYYDFKKGVDREDTIGGMSITSGEFKPCEIKSLAIALMTVAVVSGIILVVCTGLPTLYFGIAGALLTVLYPWLKYHALGDVDIFLTYSVLPILGTTYVATGEIGTSALWLALPIGLITVGILHVNNTRDIVPDKRAGIKTFAMLAGEKASAYLYCLDVIVPFIWVAGGIAMGKFPLLSLLIIPALKPAMDNVRKVMAFLKKDAKELYGVDENTAKLQLAFSMLLTLSLFIDKLFL